MPVLLMNDLKLTGQRILIREDFNVPVRKAMVSSDARIRAALPTIRLALDAGAKVMLMSHLGRPVEGGSAEKNQIYSLAPVAEHLAKLLNCRVPLIKDWQQGLTLTLAYTSPTTPPRGQGPRP